MAKRRKPLFLDADYLIVGSFVEFIEAETEPGWRIPVYIPANQPFTKVQYDKPVHMDHIHPGTSISNARGSFKEGQIIFRGAQDGAFSFINNENIKKIQELREQIKDLQVELTSTRQRMEESNTGASDAVARASQIIKTKNEADKSGGIDLSKFDKL